MPLLYSEERENVFKRLQKEINEALKGKYPTLVDI